MKVEVKETGKLTRTLSFEFGSGTVEKKFEEFFNEIREQADVPGFRKGQATNQALRMRYTDLARAEVSARLVYDGVSDFYQKNSNYIGSPVVSEQYRANNKRKYVGEFKLDGSFVCSVDAEIEPTIDVVGYKDLLVSEPLPNLDMWVNNKLQDYQFTFASRQPIFDRQTKTGDEVIVDAECYQNDELVLDSR